MIRFLCLSCTIVNEATAGSAATSRKIDHKEAMNLEDQIMEARRRAELFTKSLQETRLKENTSLKALEEERAKWTQTFEEKSVMIDQLERELNFTVSAMHGNESSGATSFPIPPTYTASYHNPMPPAIPPPTQREIDDMRSFIIRLQNEFTQLSEKHNRLIVEDSQKKLQVDNLEAEIRRLEEEKRLHQLAIRDYDGKLHFRLNQVKHVCT